MKISFVMPSQTNFETPQQMERYIFQLKNDLLEINPTERLKIINELFEYCQSAKKLKCILNEFQKITVAEIIAASSCQNKIKQLEDSKNTVGIEWVMRELNVSRQTVYGWVNKRRIPYGKVGKSLIFDKQEIHAWIKSNKAKTKNEIGEAAVATLKKTF